MVSGLLLLAGCQVNAWMNRLQPEGGWSAEDTAGWFDRDQDGLRDDEELELGTDPDDFDSDNDGYGDGDEICAGTDPLDGISVIYQGGWPFECDKDALPEGQWGPALSTPGEPVQRLVGTDQYGDEVDLFDLHGAGRPVVIAVLAGTSQTCHDVSRCLAGDLYIDELYREAVLQVSSGQILWVTVLWRDEDGNEADAEDVAAWHTAYPHYRVLVLTDPGGRFVTNIQPAGLPSLSLIHPNFTWAAVDDDQAVFSALLE